MSDVAVLGIQIDSRSATQATAALTGLAGAAKQASPAVSALEKAAQPANVALATMQKATASASKEHVGLSTQALAASHSIRNLVEGLAMGMPATTILAQNLSHLSFAASGPGGLSGAFREAGAALAGFITPARAIGVGIAAATVGFLAWGRSVATAEKSLQDLGERAGMSLGKIATLQSAARSEGIGGEEFTKNMQRFAELTEEGRQNLGPLVDLFRANNKTIGDTNTNLNTLSDILSHAKSTQAQYNILAELGLTASREWGQLLGQGSAHLADVQSRMTQISDVSAQRLADQAREIDKQFNEVAATISTKLKNAFLGAYDIATNFSQRMEEARQRAASIREQMKPATFDQRFNAATGSLNYPATSEQFGPPKPVDSSATTLAALQRQISLEQQRIGILGQTATVEQQVRAVELQIQAARLQGVSITSREADNLKRLAQERALGIDQIHQTTDGLRTEIAAFGMDVGQAAAFTAVQNKINEARRNGVPLTQTQIDLIRRESVAYAESTQKLSDMRFASDTLGGAFKDFRTQIQNGATSMQALQHAALTALNAISDKLLDMAAKKLVDLAFSSGGTNFLSALFPIAHGGYGPGDALLAARAVSPAAFLGAPRFHSGIGPDEQPAIIRKDESVLTPGQMRALGGGSRNSVTMNNSVHVTLQGGAPGDDGQARKFAGMIATEVRRVALETIRDQRRPGGLLAQ